MVIAAILFGLHPLIAAPTARPRNAQAPAISETG